MQWWGWLSSLMSYCSSVSMWSLSQDLTVLIMPKWSSPWLVNLCNGHGSGRGKGCILKKNKRRVRRGGGGFRRAQSGWNTINLLELVKIFRKAWPFEWFVKCQYQSFLKWECQRVFFLFPFWTYFWRKNVVKLRVYSNFNKIWSNWLPQ